MPAVIVRLEEQEYRRLGAMAARQTREPDQQATHLIRRALAREQATAGLDQAAETNDRQVRHAQPA